MVASPVAETINTKLSEHNESEFTILENRIGGNNMKPMLITNNQRKMHRLPLWRKKNNKKRVHTRCKAEEAIKAFNDYSDQ